MPRIIKVVISPFSSMPISIIIMSHEIRMKKTISIINIFLFYLLLVLFKRARSKICVPSVIALQ